MDLDMKHGSQLHASSSTSSHDGLHGGTSETILISGLEVCSVGPFVFACICIAVVAFLLEMARHLASIFESKLTMEYEEKLNLITSTFENSHVISNNGGKLLYSGENSQVTHQDSSSMSKIREKIKFSRKFKSLIILGFLYSSSYLVATLLMLIAMTYNIYLIISVCIGITTGKLLSVYLKSSNPRIE